MLSVGKAAAAMAAVAAEGCARPVEGFLLTKTAHISPALRSRLGGFELWEAGHPIPDHRSLQATERLLQWLEEVRVPRHLLVLLSGGTSSLLELPNPPLTLQDLVELHRVLLGNGWPIERINVLRKHLSQVKGGGLGVRLARRFHKVTQLVATDICLPGHGPETLLPLVGSGPTLADPSTQDEALALLLELGPAMTGRLARRCREALRETPKNLNLQAEQLISHETMKDISRALIPQSLLCEDRRWPSLVEGDVKDLAKTWSEIATSLQESGLHGIFVATGEPTVKLTSENPGRGGRCQDLALRFAQRVCDREGIELLAGSSDGTDGPTPYAGAVVDGKTWPSLVRKFSEQTALGCLKNHDSTTLLEGLPDALLDTGPTGLNINDLFFLRISQQNRQE